MHRALLLALALAPMLACGAVRCGAVRCGAVRCGAGPGAAATPCGRFPAHEGYGDADMPRVDGFYGNGDYSYSVNVPSGLTAYGAAAPAPNHGVGIVLSWEQRAYVFVDATYDVLDWATPREAARWELASTREDSTRVLSVRRTSARLGTLRALRQVVRHRCAGRPEVYVDDAVIALDPARTIVYKAR